MGEPARTTTLYEKFLEVPDHLVAEVVCGELYTSPRPGLPHAIASSSLGISIGSRFAGRGGDGDNPGGWWILDEPELHLGEDILVPDLAGWRRERLPKIPREAFITLAPDWVCEVISPSTERLDRILKKRVYAREGVAHMWLVNPDARTLEVLRRVGEFWQEVGLYEGDAVIRAEPFDAVELDMAPWWEMG